MTEALDAHMSKVKSMEKSLQELRLYELIARDKKDDVEKQLDDLKDLPKERLARIHLKLGDKDKAVKLGKEAVEGSTNQVETLANYVAILHECEKKDEAKEQFGLLRAVASQADLNLPALDRLKPLAKSLGFKDDWRLPYTPATDVGDRPSLDALGPFRWGPSPAPDFVLRDSDNDRIALKDYRGKPALVIFYLGHGCVHCIEQLNLFAPMASEYKQSGISLLAISTDSVEGLKNTFEKSKSEDGFPFPIVSNEKLDVFKAYRAYDDFEKMPLHGTFLIDGNGMVRWQDISYEPFTETAFLLKEAKRLLNLSGGALLTEKKPVLKSPRAGSL